MFLVFLKVSRVLFFVIEHEQKKKKLEILQMTNMIQILMNSFHQSEDEEI